jgi:predicted PurR-regulated permease PerM
VAPIGDLRAAPSRRPRDAATPARCRDLADAISSDTGATPMPPTSATTPATPELPVAAKASHELVPEGAHAVPMVRIPVNARGLALTILAVIAVVGALEVAQPLVVSLLLGILAAYALNPLVVLLERIRIPRAAAAVVVMVSVMTLLGFGGYSLRGQMQAIIEQLPDAARTFSGALARMRADPAGNIRKMQSAAAEVEAATTQATGGAPARKASTQVVDAPGFKFGNALMAGSMGVAGFLGQAVMVLFLTFFLLLGGDTFKRKLVRLTGPTLSNKKITVQILDDINGSIQKYLFMLLSTNVLVAVLAWIAFRWIGLENAGAWAVASGLLHVVPYLGPGITAASAGMAAFMQFESLPLAFLVCGASLAIATVVGTFITTWMTGRIAKMNSAAVFISLLFWGWLWGIWGMLLGIPLVVIVKVVSEHVVQLQPVAELLGE